MRLPSFRGNISRVHPTVPRIHVLACGVLAADLRALAPQIPARLTLDILPGKLHQTPAELRHRLQARIDAVSADGSADIIAIAYGICGRGTVGLAARQVPLRLPRVHDCIALFLGSDAAYREQFARYPGTYYVSAGWVSEGMGSGAACGDSAERQAWEAHHGADNAKAIAAFFDSWKKNYQRAAFIDTGIGNRHFADIARTLAADNNWLYEELPGSHHLLTTLLSGAADERVLDVPPGFITRFDAVARHLTAAPVRASKPAVRASETDQATAVPPQRTGIGLGIDAGGTYTDAALFDWGTRRVLAKSKAPTSHWDYATGIDAALAGLPAALLQQVALVSVSTTLATNAIVEGKGRKVALLLMPPSDGGIDDGIHHRPAVVVRGRIGIDGQPRQPVDADEICRVAHELATQQDVQAFAVTGYASHINPDHEEQIRALLRAETGLPVTCGHDVSSIRNYRVRAETAALNARIVPCLQALMERLRDCLALRDIQAPLMVVRSDGSLMNLATALERPVETLLSGPAASVAGARFLCNLPEALVIDIGGTTSDTAVLHGGQVRTDPDGATVGHWRTHVKALAVRTLGLGGDSAVHVERRAWQVGPRRVTPICRLGENAAPACVESCLSWMEAHRDSSPDGGWMIYARLPTSVGDAHLTDRQRQVLAWLDERPASVPELVARAGCLKAAFLELEPLAERQWIRPFGLTPTDALHLLGKMSLWDTAIARRHATLVGDATGVDADALARLVEERVVRRMARELLMTRLADLTGTRLVEGDHGLVGRALLERGLGETHDGLDVSLRVGVPLIGIGAPAGFFLPAAAQRLNTEAIIPGDGDVANAIGAITSGIRVERHAEIRVDERGTYHLDGLPGAPTFAEMPFAQAHAEHVLRARVRELACQAGASDPDVTLTVRDRVATVGEGDELLIGRTLTAVASGLPGTVAPPQTDTGALSA